MLLQAAPPPPPAVASPAPQLQRLAPVAQKAKSLLLTKAGRTENVVIRQQMFLRTVAKPGAVPVPAVDGVTISAVPCAWAIESYLQRDICFYSITGLLGCTDTITKPLMATETGQGELAAGATCDVAAKPIVDAEGRAAAALDRLRDQMFDEDYKLAVKPQLAGTGAVIKER